MDRDLSLFQAADGLPFWSGSRSLVLSAGYYPTGHGALLVMEGGSPAFKLTVNMAEVEGVPELAFDEFCVKSSEVAAYSNTLLNKLKGVFVATDQHFEAGYVSSYAEVWRFGKCEKHGSPDYVIRCITCRMAIRELWADMERQHLAKQSVKMLKERRL